MIGVGIVLVLMLVAVRVTRVEIVSWLNRRRRRRMVLFAMPSLARRFMVPGRMLVWRVMRIVLHRLRRSHIVGIMRLKP